MNNTQPLESFKQAWHSLALPQVVSNGSDVMPRQSYALCFALVATQAAEGNARARKALDAGASEDVNVSDWQAAIIATTLSVVGNASQLGAALLKDGFLSKPQAIDSTTALLARLAALSAKP